jgi:hypothetical protein
MLGTQFTRLTVTAEAPRAHRKRRWHCSCACGGSTVAFQWSLLAGRSRSCGCLKGEELNARQGHENHGLRDSAEYKIWQVMKKRCYNVKHRDYRGYGGAGVTVCEPWRNSFLTFYRDVGPRPSPAHRLRRIREDEGFCPENCRWVIRRSRNEHQTPQGLEFIADVSSDDGLDYTRVKARED